MGLLPQHRAQRVEPGQLRDLVHENEVACSSWKARQGGLLAVLRNAVEFKPAPGGPWEEREEEQGGEAEPGHAGSVAGAGEVRQPCWAGRPGLEEVRDERGPRG